MRMKNFTLIDYWRNNSAKLGNLWCQLLPGDERLYKALKKQDNIYTLTVCGRDGKDEVYCIGSLVELIWGVENPKAVIDKIADKDIKILR